MCTRSNQIVYLIKSTATKKCGTVALFIKKKLTRQKNMEALYKNCGSTIRRHLGNNLVMRVQKVKWLV